MVLPAETGSTICEMREALRRSKRKAALAAALGLAVVATAVPMVVSGTASAQSGSRLCGQYWRSPHTFEVITRFFEVRKSDRPVCNKAKQGGSPHESPFSTALLDQNREGWQGDSFSFRVCETTPGSEYEETRYGWKDRPLDVGGLGGLNLNFVGEDWPKGVRDHHDICNNMNRSDNIFSMERYWLYSRPGWDTVPFDRH